MDDEIGALLPPGTLMARDATAGIEYPATLSRWPGSNRPLPGGRRYEFMPVITVGAGLLFPILAYAQWGFDFVASGAGLLTGFGVGLALGVIPAFVLTFLVLRYRVTVRDMKRLSAFWLARLTYEVGQLSSRIASRPAPYRPQQHRVWVSIPEEES